MGWSRGDSGTETWTDPQGWDCWGPRHTRERVSPFIAEATDSCQHLVLAAEGAEVPLGLGVSTVLSQAWAGAVLGAELPSAHTASPGHQAGYTFAPGQVTRSSPSPCRSPHLPGLGGGSACGWPGTTIGRAVLRVPQEALCLLPNLPFLRIGPPLGGGRICGDTSGRAVGQGVGTHRLGLYLAQSQRAQ